MIEQLLQADRLLQVDQIEKARSMYQSVFDLDPNNAIAVVGLARCALAEGDDALAYRLASQALEIDPENDMARRMEARLSEVMATRGEAPERPAAAGTPAPHEMRPVVAGAGAEGAPPDEEEAASATERATSPEGDVQRRSWFGRLMGR